ncbi:MAG: glutamine amidotransferase [Colwellia sp.]|nr:glutamine amidotransferase [Colwellia sp.]
MRVHFIIHEAYEGPGAFMNWVTDNSYQASSSKIYLGQSLPEDIKVIDILIILGGPQSPDTTPEQCHYFNVDKEVAFIRACIESGKAIVGVCLGAQLIGEALGAKFVKSPDKEIGYFPIDLSEQGIEHTKLAHFKHQQVVGHWHNDMPGLTADSKVLATSAGCPRQIVEYSALVYGFQCHLEFTSASVYELIEVSAGDFADIEQHHFVQPAELIVAYNTLAMNKLLFKFMDKLVLAYT